MILKPRAAVAKQGTGHNLRHIAHRVVGLPETKAQVALAKFNPGPDLDLDAPLAALTTTRSWSGTGRCTAVRVRAFS